MIAGLEFHDLVVDIFKDVKNAYKQEQIQICCPKCSEYDYEESDGKYNLEINTRKRIFKCWKCDDPKFSGSLGKLIKLYGSQMDYTLYKALNIYDYSNFYEYKNDEEEEFQGLPEEMIFFNKIDANNPKHRQAYLYMLEDRKISKKNLLKYNIGFCLEGKYKNRIIIPSINKNGEFDYFVARSFVGEKPTYLNPKFDKDKIIFNEGFINWDSTIYIVEGIFDRFALPENTIPILGKNLPSTLIDRIQHHKPNIVVVLDPDAIKNAISITDELLSYYNYDNNKVKIVELTGKNDIDEIRRNIGEFEVVNSLKKLRTLTDADYFRLKKFT